MILEQIDKDLLAMAKESDSVLKDIYENIDDICLYNSNRILSAFIENQVSYSDFADINGYGNYDEGRDKIERIFCFGIRLRRCPGASTNHVRNQRTVFNIICSFKTWRYHDFYFR